MSTSINSRTLTKPLPNPRLKNMRRLITVLVIVIIAGMVRPGFVMAQDLARSVASNLEVADTDIKGGDIVAQTDKGIVRANVAYQTAMFGVAVDNPIIVLHDKTDKTRAITQTGDVIVNVSAKGGGIKPGDFVTSSDIPGVAIRAVESGYVLGIAKTGFTPQGSEVINGSNATGTITVYVNIHFHASKVSDLGNSFVRIFRAFAGGVEDNSQFSSIIRYVLGAIVALVSFIVAFFFFGRNVKSGIDAMGRNPLARSTIQFNMMMNLGFTGAVVLVGLFVAFMIIRF